MALDSEVVPLVAVVVLPADVPADAVTPGISPAPVEPVSGDLVVEPKRKAGRPPIAGSLRMNLIQDFVSGKLPAKADKRLAFIKNADLTVGEKAYLVKHPFFKDIYDARLFDMFMGIEVLTKEDLKMMQIVALRTGLAKPMQMNVKNMKMDAQDSKVSIQVQK